ncbi:MAG TPA: T9SS type A sorting domain-containing protein [Paludibacter sp.]
MKKQFSWAILLLIFSISTVSSQTPAFPTAEGFGKFTSGGRGGQVVEVTSLADYLTTEIPIPGTLRWALAQYSGQPLTVVFRVSGIIALKADLRSSRANLTIAGQTAPGDGICIRGGKMNFGGSVNLLIRHVRFRIGLSNGNDGTFLAGGSLGFENGSNAIFDHCTFGWAGEENVTMYDDHYITVQWCILHEGLYTAGHAKGERSYACQWAGSPATMHHNLLAHNVNRSCRFNGANNASGDRNVLIDYVNNVNYNWGKVNSCYGGEREAGKFSTHEVNFVGNYYKPGPATPTSGSYFFEQSAARSGYVLAGPSYWYVTGNVMEGDASGTADNWMRVHNNTSYPIDSLKSLNARVIPDAYKIAYTTAQEAYAAVLAKAGAFPRDTVDRRIVNEVATKTASGKGTIEKYPSSISGTDTTWTTNKYYNLVKGIIDQPAGAGGYPAYNTFNEIVDNDHDGMADAWETANGLNPADATDRNLLTKDGYTALEVYLNSLVGEMIEHDFKAAGIAQVTAHKIELFPTIATDKLMLTSSLSLKSVSFFSLDGTEIRNIIVDGNSSIGVTFLKQGCYMVRVTTESGDSEQFKLVKK